MCVTVAIYDCRENYEAIGGYGTHNFCKDLVIVIYLKNTHVHWYFLIFILEAHLETDMTGRVRFNLIDHRHCYAGLVRLDHRRDTYVLYRADIILV